MLASTGFSITSVFLSISLVSIRDGSVIQRHLILGFVYILPHLIVFLHHIISPGFARQGSVRIYRRRNMDSVLLNVETVIAHYIRVLHSYEARQYRHTAFDSKTESTSFQRFGLAVVPPHTLLRVEKHKVPLCQQLVKCCVKLFHRVKV